VCVELGNTEKSDCHIQVSLLAYSVFAMQWSISLPDDLDVGLWSDI
jgi:hypothetical protein